MHQAEGVRRSQGLILIRYANDNPKKCLCGSLVVALLASAIIGPFMGMGIEATIALATTALIVLTIALAGYLATRNSARPLRRIAADSDTGTLTYTPELLAIFNGDISRIPIVSVDTSIDLGNLDKLVFSERCREFSIFRLQSTTMKEGEFRKEVFIVKYTMFIPREEAERHNGRGHIWGDYLWLEYGSSEKNWRLLDARRAIWQRRSPKNRFKYTHYYASSLFSSEISSLCDGHNNRWKKFISGRTIGYFEQVKGTPHPIPPYILGSQQRLLKAMHHRVFQDIPIKLGHVPPQEMSRTLQLHRPTSFIVDPTGNIDHMAAEGIPSDEKEVWIIKQE